MTYGWVWCDVLVPMFFCSKNRQNEDGIPKTQGNPVVTPPKTKMSSWEFKGTTPPNCHLPGNKAFLWGLITPRRALFPGLAWRSAVDLNSHSTPLPPESLAILSRKAFQNCSGLASDQGSGYGTWGFKGSGQVTSRHKSSWSVGSQPSWTICLSKRVHLPPRFGFEHTKCLKTATT